MQVSSTTKDKFAVSALQGLGAHLLEDETVTYLSYVLNIRPAIGGFAVTQARVILLDHTWGIWNEMPFYDIENWLCDQRRRHFHIWLKDQTGIILKGIESVDTPMLLDAMVASAAIPLDDPRVIALARRNRRTDIDATSHEPQTVPASDVHEAGQDGAAKPQKIAAMHAVEPGAVHEPVPVPVPLQVLSESTAAQVVATEPVVSPHAPQSNPTDDLERLIGMFDRGLLSQEEFQQAKQRLLGS